MTMEKIASPIADFKPTIQRIQTQLREVLAIGHELQEDMKQEVLRLKALKITCKKVIDQRHDSETSFEMAHDNYEQVANTLGGVYQDIASAKRYQARYAALQKTLKQVMRGDVVLTKSILQKMERFNLMIIQYNQLIDNRKVELASADAQRKIRSMKKYV